MKCLQQRSADCRVGAGCNQRGGLAAGDLLRKTGPAENAGMQTRCGLGEHFMPEQTQRLESRCAVCGDWLFDPLAQPNHGCAHAAQLLQHRAQRRHRRCHHHQVVARHRRLHRPVAVCAAVPMSKHQRLGQRNTRKVARVNALLLHGAALPGAARPQAHRVARGQVAAGADGQRRSPGACAEHCNFHRHRTLAPGRGPQTYWVTTAGAWPAACARCCSYIAWKLISERCTGGKPLRWIRSATLARRYG